MGCVEAMRQGAGAGGFDEDCWADLAVQCGGISPTSLRSVTEGGGGGGGWLWNWVVQD